MDFTQSKPIYWTNWPINSHWKTGTELFILFFMATPLWTYVKTVSYLFYAVIKIRNSLSIPRLEQFELAFSKKPNEYAMLSLLGIIPLFSNLRILSLAHIDGQVKNENFSFFIYINFSSNYCPRFFRKLFVAVQTWSNLNIWPIMATSCQFFHGFPSSVSFEFSGFIITRKRSQKKHQKW